MQLIHTAKTHIKQYCLKANYSLQNQLDKNSYYCQRIL